jgi:microcystin-dependent protein
VIAARATGVNVYGTTTNGTFAPDEVTPTGSGQPHENRQPFLALNFCICLVGFFPSRS